MFGRQRTRRRIVDDFHQLYYDSRKTTWMNTHWMGIEVLKCPMDLWIYQELLHEQRPDAIIETGTWSGGSALFMASICDIIGNGRILTIDTHPKEERPEHERITYMTASSVSEEAIDAVRNFTEGAENVLVILDSDHRRDHVIEELRAYNEFPRAGNYLIVEDTNVNGHPVYQKFGPGPMEALDDFLAENRDFEIDAGREKFMMTFNPRGFLRRKQ